MPPLRPELQAAHDEMDATGEDFAFSVCHTWDDKAWEVNTKQGNIYSALDVAPTQATTKRQQPVRRGFWSKPKIKFLWRRSPRGRGAGRDGLWL